MATKPVTIKIIRKLISPERDQFFPADEGRADIENNMSELENSNIGDVLNPINIKSDGDFPLMFEVKGVMTEENGEISISYETHLAEPMPTITTYSFKTKKRDVLAVNKRSFNDLITFFETKRKSQWLSDISQMAGEDSTCFTKMLKNYISYENGGHIELEYYIEIGGEMFEYNKEYFIVEPIK